LTIFELIFIIGSLNKLLNQFFFELKDVKKGNLNPHF
jgi:hypothetical protein